MQREVKTEDAGSVLEIITGIVKCERCGQAGKAFCLAALNGTDLGEQNKSTVCSHMETAGTLHIWHTGSTASTFSHIRTHVYRAH